MTDLSARSASTIFAFSNHHLPASTKISMLRLFSDVIEFSDPTADGWTVHSELKKAYNKESVPVSQNSISWLLRNTAKEKFVAFGPKTIWSALQHTVRSFLVHGRNEKVLERLLGIDTPKNERGENRGSMELPIAHWLALRGSERELLPMLLYAGRLLHMREFDWIEDDITPSQFVKALPVIYTTWSLALPNCIDKVEELLGLELGIVMGRMGWTREYLSNIIGEKAGAMEEGQLLLKEGEMRWSGCGDDYSRMGIGVVEPARIAFLECVKTGHRLPCQCAGFLDDVNFTLTLSTLSLHSCTDTSTDTETNADSVDEEFPLLQNEEDETKESTKHRCIGYMVSQADIGEQHGQDPFVEAAITLYRVQGRSWLRENGYMAGMVLCATCFLKGEGYVGENGAGSEGEFLPMPESFEMFRSEGVSSTFMGS